MARRRIGIQPYKSSTYPALSFHPDFDLDIPRMRVSSHDGGSKKSTVDITTSPMNPEHDFVRRGNFQFPGSIPDEIE